MVLQVAFLGGGVLAERAKKLSRVQVEFHMLLEVAAVGGLVLAVRAGKRFGAVVDLPGVAGHLVLVGCQVVTTLTLERTLTCTKEAKSQTGAEDNVTGETPKTGHAGSFLSTPEHISLKTRSVKQGS